MGGVLGGLSGALCIGYAMFFSFAVSSRNSDLLKVIMMARLSLGVLYVIGGAYLAVRTDLPRAVIFFCYAAFALPEAYLLFTYAAAIQREIDIANMPREAAVQLQNTNMNRPPASFEPPQPPPTVGGQQYAPPRGGPPD